MTAPAHADEERASFAQERLWLLQQVDPADTSYNLIAPLFLPEGSTPQVVRAALGDLVARHESLRTCFEAREGVLYQCVLAAFAPPLTLHDLREDRPEARDAAVQALLAREMATPFDLAGAPPLRCHHVLLGDGQSLLVAAMHHCIADGWSINLMARDLSEFCQARIAGRAPLLPPLDYQYVHYSAWQRGQAEGEAVQGQLGYWRERLAGAPPVLELPLDRPRGPSPDTRGGTWLLPLEPALRDALAELARTENATLFMVLMAGFQALLARLGGQEDVVVASPVSVRPRVEFEEIFGCFLNNVLIRGRPERAKPFRAFLREIQGDVLEAFAHQDVPLELVIEALKPPRTRSYNPLFQTMFVLQNAPSDGGQEGWTIAEGPGPDVRAKFELSMALWESAAGIGVSIEYRRDLFDEATIAALASAYRALLADAAARPDAPIGQLALLEPAVRARMLEEWNDVPLDYPDAATIHGLFEEWAARQPDATALIFEGRHYGYGELNAAANRIAHRLIALGVGPETTVAVLTEQSPEMLVALLAVLKAGGAYVPIDPTLPPGRIAYLIESVAPRALLTLERHCGLIEEPQVPVFALDRERFEDQPTDDPAPRAGARDLAYVIFTSGSTGMPKGVEVEHRSVLHHLWGMRAQYAVTPHDRFLQKHPFNFDVSVWEFFLPLTTGGSTVMVRPGGQRDIAYLIDLMVAHGVTIVCFLPSVLQILLDDPRVGLLGGALRWMLCGAEAMARDVPPRFFEKLPRARLHNLYGPTETTVHNSWYECQPGPQPAVIPIGRPMPGVRLYILDGEGAPVPVGVAGEIHIGGASVARGYRGSPEATAAKFVPDPFTRGADARMYRTGDMGRFRGDGNIEFLGRRDQQYKIRGFRIELGEIAHVLRGAADVADAIAVVREDVPGEPRIIGYVVPRGAGDAEAVMAHARRNLPQHMLPSALVLLDQLPLRANDKVDPAALPAPDRVLRSAGPPPETREEVALAAIWQLLLGRAPAGVDEDFFELGGHSLLAARLVAQVRARLGVALPVRAVFENPGLGAMARAVAAAPPAPDDLRAQLARPARTA